MAKLKYRHLVARKMNNEPEASSKLPDESVYVATPKGVFVIPRRFLPQVLEGIDEVAKSIVDGQDSLAS